MTVYPIDLFYFIFDSTIYIDFFSFITSLYQLCQSLVTIEWYILMLYHNCITRMYFIALYVLFVFLCTMLENIAVRCYINQ